MEKLDPAGASAFEGKQYFERRLGIRRSESGQYRTPEPAVW
jgi:hypothetical protein